MRFTRTMHFALVVVILLALGLGGCQKADWNWDLNWWHAKDRRVEPTDQTVRAETGPENRALAPGRSTSTAPAELNDQGNRSSADRGSRDASRSAGTGS